MMRFVNSVAVLLVLSVFCGSISAQNAATIVPCSQFTGMATYPQNWTGTWYELSTSNPNNTLTNCVSSMIAYNATNQIFSVNTTYSLDTSNLFKHNYTLTETDMSAYNAQNTDGSQGIPVNGFTYKLVATDNYTTYALVCGYPQANVSASFGIVLAKNYAASYTGIYNMGVNTTTEFNSTTGFTIINQNQACYKSGAATTVPLVSALLVTIAALLKFVN